MSQNVYSQAIVIGAGPAGLGVSIGLARKGISVTVIEQQDHIGTIRRGETIRYDMHMAEILGPGFFESITIRKVKKRRYFTHTGNNHVDRTIKNPNIIFEWPRFMNEIALLAARSGVSFHTSSHVTMLIEQSGRVRGVVAETDVTKEYLADTIFSCGGCSDPASQHIGQDRNGIDMPVAKRLVKGYSGPDDRLEYHLHLRPSGMMVGTMFPRGGDEAEFILLDTSAGNRTLPMFDEFCHYHPRFGQLLHGTQTFYELQTYIPMGGMLYPFSPRAGLIMAGDALGHVQARGGSGIKTSFLIGHAAGTLAADVMHSGDWTEEKRKKFEQKMKDNPHVKSIRLHNLVFSHLRSKVFQYISSPEDMDKKWPFLKIALR
jgi:flavin-dependent dehydrogenase